MTEVLFFFSEMVSLDSGLQPNGPSKSTYQERRPLLMTLFVEFDLYQNSAIIKNIENSKEKTGGMNLTMGH